MYRLATVMLTDLPCGSITSRWFCWIWLGALVMAMGGIVVVVGPASARRRAEAGRASTCTTSTCGVGRCAGFAKLALLLVIVAGAAPSFAVQPDEIMSNAAQETRARALSRELRCMVCQNESIDDSGAPLARDLRLLVRERIAAGDTDTQVLDFLVARYGEFVLLKPRLEVQTLALWRCCRLSCCCWVDRAYGALRPEAAAQGLRRARRWGTVCHAIERGRDRKARSSGGRAAALNSARILIKSSPF